MPEKELFDGLAEQSVTKASRDGGKPRMREPERRQVELRPVDLDSLLSADHPARVIWRYVERLDLSVLEDAIGAREHTPGQAPASPRLLLALWLYATSQGVGSARALERLCASHDAYRWLCGGVSVNYHGLAAFRSGHGELLDRLLTHNIAALMAPTLSSSIEAGSTEAIVKPSVEITAVASMSAEAPFNSDSIETNISERIEIP
jgi:transposase